MTWNHEQVAEIKQLWDRGRMTAEAIGLRFGTTKNAIVGLAYRKGWDDRRRQPRPQQKFSDMPVSRVRECAWPHGDPLKPGFHFCGAPPVEGKPYCDDHCAVAYTNWREDEGND